MTPLEQQAESNAWAKARELGMPRILINCRKAGMSWDKTEQVMVLSADKRNPWQWANKLISAWRAER